MSQKIILLVEDQPDDEELTIRALGKNKTLNKIVVVRDGAEALEYLFGTGSHVGCSERDMPHLILLDLKLPKVDGLEVLKRLRTDPRTLFLPIVIMTASQEEQDLIQSYQLGANSYIRKPIDLVDFTRSVQQLGLYWLALHDPVPAELATFSGR
ncbi:MAG: response regulator [Nitrospirota bacterium]|nr:response regulator [Nitrospirota bacterium]